MNCVINKILHVDTYLGKTPPPPRQPLGKWLEGSLAPLLSPQTTILHNFGKLSLCLHIMHWKLFPKTQQKNLSIRLIYCRCNGPIQGVREEVRSYRDTPKIKISYVTAETFYVEWREQKTKGSYEDIGVQRGAATVNCPPPFWDILLGHSQRLYFS